jgi:hypothetical protein
LHGRPIGRPYTCLFLWVIKDHHAIARPYQRAAPKHSGMNMNQSPSKTQRRRLPRYLRNGLLLLALPVLLVAVGYGAIELFARYGGDWAMRDQLPVPPDSQQIDVLYSNAEFIMKTVFYTHDGSPETLRDWFIDQGITLSSTGVYRDYEASSNENAYFVLGYEVETSSRKMHRDAIRRTHPELLWIGDIQAGCGGWTIFRTEEGLKKLFPQVTLEVPADKTVFALHTCWPNVDKAPPNQPVYPIN